MLDVIALVSADSDVASHITQLTSLHIAKETVTYRSGIDLLDVLEHYRDSRAGLVVIDTNCGSIPAYNLIDAVRMVAPQMRVILLAEPSSSTGEVNARDVEKAMLAGASAVVAKSESAQSLCTIVRRVASSHVSEEEVLATGYRGRVVACVGARGGAGRSTVACLLAEAFGARGLQVALVDFDLQFGDLGFLFNRTEGPTLFEMMQSAVKHEQSIARFGREISEYVTLFSPEPSPEKAEHLYGEVRPCVALIAAEYDVVVINTGAFWTVFHAEVLESADHVVCITDQSVVGARATKQLMALCEKLQIPTRRFSYVANKLHAYGLSSNDIASGLGVSEICSIPMGGDEFSLLVESGRPRAALERYGDVEVAFNTLTSHVAEKAGIAINSQSALVKDLQDDLRKRRWWSWR